MKKVDTYSEYTVADFFCGAGGFSEGFHQSGFKVIFCLDNWKPAIKTHDLNHVNCKSKLMNILDIKTEDIDKIIPDTNVIIGSPPCVSFSNSNKSGKADKTLGLQLIKQFLKIVLYKLTKEKSILKYWIMENVPNSIKYIKDEYTALELGLDSNLPNLIVKEKKILTASNYGSPQKRKRAICGNFVVPKITHNEKNFKFINHVLKDLGQPLNNNKKKITDPFNNKIKINKSELSDHFYDSELPEEWWKKAKKLKTDHGYMGKMEFPDKKVRLCRTIMATESYCSRESIIFNKEKTEKYRAPTIRELASLMGFPINYQIEGTSSTIKHKQIGNAVCVHLAKALADAIKEHCNLKFKNTKPRVIPKIIFNLNDISSPLFSNFIPNKIKKINCKFHMHVPYIKINGIRIELDNRDSDFKNNKIIWKSFIHKGSGKNAIKAEIKNDNIIKILKNHKKFNHINSFIENNISKKIYNSLIFQQKLCNIENNKTHYSPIEILEIISSQINFLDCSNEKIEVENFDKIFKYKKKMLYSYDILYCLYCVNKITTLLN